jgi:hypothetical protein
MGKARSINLGVPLNASTEMLRREHSLVEVSTFLTNLLQGAPWPFDQKYQPSIRKTLPEGNDASSSQDSSAPAFRVRRSGS